MKIIVLAGGCGKRLWPLSSSACPKQFLAFGGKESLLQITLRRFLERFDSEDFLIVTQNAYASLIQEQVRHIDKRLAQRIFIEPARKNTAPALFWAVEHLLNNEGMSPEETILITPSDHYLDPPELFLDSLLITERKTKEGKLIAYGIRPTSPATGYGYMQTKPLDTSLFLSVMRFVEKPAKKNAEKYLLSGDYFWNMGVYLMQAAVLLKEMELHCPEMLVQSPDAMPSLSIDYALMEKTKNLLMFPLRCSWSDIGSWESVYAYMDKDKEQNVKIGNVNSKGTKNCLIIGGKRLITAVGVEDLLIIETEEALFLGKRADLEKFPDVEIPQ